MPTNKPSPPTQMPKRSPDFYKAIITDWRTSAIMSDVSDQELVILAAQFTGLSVAAIDTDVTIQVEYLELAVNALRTAYSSRMAVKQGLAKPRPHRRSSDVPRPPA